MALREEGLASATRRFDYSMFGLPRLVPTNTVPGSAYGTDLDNDGIITNGLNPDGGVDINDQLAFLALFEIGDPRGDLADVNGFTVPDEACDINDLLYFLNNFESGFNVAPEPVRFGWRGYLWDGRLNVHHVRHRVFDPKLMTWLQPDPLGTIDGPNIYAYAGWDPFNKIDPYGLDGYILTGWLRGYVVGTYLDDSIDGLRELVSPESEVGRDAQRTIVRTAVVTAVVVTVVATGGGALVAAGGGAALVGHGVFAVAGATGIYYGSKITYMIATGTDPDTGRNLTEDEITHLKAEALGTAIGGGAAGAGQRPTRGPATGPVRVRVTSNPQTPATATPALPESYWVQQHAPKQVTPGIRTLVESKPSGRSAGEVYVRVSHYDQHGRLVAQTHYTSHGEPAIHPNPHHHQYDPGTGGALRSPDGSRVWPGEWKGTCE